MPERGATLRPRPDARKLWLGLGHWALGVLPACLCAGLTVWLCWPLCQGQMPRSADHPVHLARIVELARSLESGSFGDWSSMWFLGFPIGQFYPPLGDLMVIGLEWVSGGDDQWPRAYAWAIAGVFCLYGASVGRVAQWLAQSMGASHSCATAAACLGVTFALFDPGFYREGGWMYAMEFGVWPQTLATACLWLGCGEWLKLILQDDLGEHDGISGVRAGLWLAAALLAHPMALPTLALVALLAAFACVRESRTDQALLRIAGPALLALALAAWWLWPMLQHRAWMASYGWLHASNEALVAWAVDGRWSQRMAPVVGYGVFFALAWLAFAGRRWAQCIALVALSHWLASSRDLYWWIRPDYLSEGFRHIQYQRFITVAKPGLFAAAALAWIWPAVCAQRSTRWPRVSAAASVALLLAAVAISGWSSMRHGTVHDVGEIQLERDPEGHVSHEDFTALCTWVARRAENSSREFKVWFRSSRNAHWYMDFPVCSGVGVYKAGFTPGANFVHKPESKRAQVLDAAHVRYIIRVSERPRPDEVARFGALAVFQRDEPQFHIHADPGTEIVVDEFINRDFRPELNFSVTKLSSPDARLRFDFAGHPRWQLLHAGKAIEWVETPLWGDGPSTRLARRRAGQLRDGKALGNDGRAPLAIAADIDSTGSYTLRWRAHSASVMAARALSMVSLGLCLLWWTAPGRRFMWAVREHAGRAMEAATAFDTFGSRRWRGRALPILLVAAAGLAAWRWTAGYTQESHLLSARVARDGLTAGQRASAGPLKTEMLIRPSVRLRARKGRPAQFTTKSMRLPATLEGWIALDDDWAQDRAQRAQLQLDIDIRPEGGRWRNIYQASVRHQPDRQPVRASTGADPARRHQIRVRLTSTGRASTQAGLELVVRSPQSP